jgi:trimethylamine--corrinoid protein Co-methyltransferase
MSVDGDSHPLLAQRSVLFSIEQLERIEEAAMRILEGVGIAVLDDSVLEQLSSCGFLTKGNRVLIERRLVRDFVEAERKRNIVGERGSVPVHRPRPIEVHSSQIELSVLGYAQRVHDIETDEIVPFTTERLIEATKLVDVLSSRGVLWSPPGCPTDVAPPLQPIVQYWVAAVYSRHGRHPVDPKSVTGVPYVMEMAEVLGHPLRSLPVYVFSPLSLGGESFKCVLNFRERLSSVSVSDMPSVGCTVPINIGDAFAVCAAEVIGSAILVKEVTDLPVSWSFRPCPIDLHSMAMVLGSPEDFLLQLASSEVNAYFHGASWYPAARSVHTNAKLPGAQACAEKASLMTAGALLGARWFGFAGTLSLDEVFSPEQFLYDVEIKDHVQRIVAGIDGDCDPERCLRDVREALKERGFVALDTTLREYRNVYWFPKLFERQFLAAWQGEGSVTIRERAHEMVRELLDKHNYELEPELRSELDKILTRARAELL